MIQTYNRLLDRAVRFAAEHPLQLVVLGVLTAFAVGSLSAAVTR